MPRLDDSQLLTQKVGTFQFSGTRPDKLGSTEYTLVTIVLDTTGSVSGFESDLLKCVQEAAEACNKSPRANNLLLRYVNFNTSVAEKHGFTPLASIDIKGYPKPYCNGLTALYDACYSAIGASNDYGKILNASDRDVNGIVFVITDGFDNASKMSVDDVARKLQEGVTGEYLESLTAILIGINASASNTILNAFAQKVGMQYIDAGNIDQKSLARLAQFISKSISSTSTSLGSGAPSQPLSF